jgi:hypothetical protein
MEVFNFTLAFSVMANDPVDARLKLKDLLKSISKEEILWAMALEDNNKSPSRNNKSPSDADMDAADADDLLDMLDLIVNSIDEHVSGDDSTDIDPSLWDDYYKAMDTLIAYGRREPRRTIWTPKSVS